MKTKSGIEYEIGSANVFADLGLPNPEERLLKSRLAGMIFDVIEARGWTQSHAAKVLGIGQPDVSKVVNGRLRDFSVERLMNFLSKLEQKITITVEDETHEVNPRVLIIEAQKSIEQAPAT